MLTTKFSMLRRTFQLRTRPRQILCLDRRKLCRDITFRVSNERYADFITTKNFFVWQRKLEVKVNVVAIKTTIIAIEAKNNDKKML